MRRVIYEEETSFRENKYQFYRAIASFNLIQHNPKRKTHNYLGMNLNNEFCKLFQINVLQMHMILLKKTHPSLKLPYD